MQLFDRFAVGHLVCCRNLYMEAGAAARNVARREAGLELGTVPVGGFDDEAVRGLPAVGPAPLILMPVGLAAA